MKEDRGGKVFVDATRVGGATVIAAYSPRVRPGVPVSFPFGWDDLDDVTPADFTVHTALEHLGDGDPWAARMPTPQRWRRTSSRRATPSRPAGCRPCTKASVGPAPVAAPTAGEQNVAMTDTADRHRDRRRSLGAPDPARHGRVPDLP